MPESKRNQNDAGMFTHELLHSEHKPRRMHALSKLDPLFYNPVHLLQSPVWSGEIGQHLRHQELTYV